jgi:hypothetical protein
MRKLQHCGRSYVSRDDTKTQISRRLFGLNLSKAVGGSAHVHDARYFNPGTQSARTVSAPGS